MHDLILRSGYVVAPGDDLRGRIDIAISDGRISELGVLRDEDATRIIDLRGAIVTPGLIDIHTHVDFGMRTEGVNARGADPELVGARAGVPTIVDAGTTGPFLFGGFRNYVINPARTRVLAFLHAGRGGITMEPDIRIEEDVDLDAFERAYERHRDVIVGVKTRLAGPGVQTLGPRIVELSKEAAARTGLPLMVHIGDHLNRFPSTGDVTRQALGLLDRGDIVEHVFTPLPGGILDASGEIMPEFHTAIKRGVAVGGTSGANFLSFRVLKKLFDAGLKPSFIATDLNSVNNKAGVYSLAETMSRYMALGLSLDEVVHLTTDAPATIIRRNETLGHLAVGRDASLTALDLIDGEWSYTDSVGETVSGAKALVPILTVVSGQVVPVDWGPHPWGWLPPPGGYPTHRQETRTVADN